LPTVWGEVLVNVADPSGELLGLPASFGQPSVFGLPVPINLTFCGFSFYVQAIGVGRSITLHCAYRCTVGF